MAKIIPADNGSKKEVVIQAASAFFREKGYSATSMRDIAEAIGVEAPSLYNHISSKKEILQVICFRVADKFVTNLKKEEMRKIPFLKKIELIIRFHIKMMLEEYQDIYISEHEWRHLPEPAFTEFQSLRKNYRAKLANLLRKGMEEKEISSVDPYVAVLTILSAIAGIDSWQQSSKKINEKTLEENIVSILIKGLSR